MKQDKQVGVTSFKAKEEQSRAVGRVKKGKITSVFASGSPELVVCLPIICCRCSCNLLFGSLFDVVALEVAPFAFAEVLFVFGGCRPMVSFDCWLTLNKFCANTGCG